MNALRVAAVLALLISVATRASAEDAPAKDVFSMPTPTPTAECARALHPGLIDGPVTIGAYLGELGSGRRACPRSEIQLGLRGGAIIDTPNFYGALALDATLTTSFAIKGRGEFFTTLVLGRYTYAQNASLKTQTLGLGPTSVGASVVAYSKEGAVVTAYLRLALPTDTEVRTPSMGGEIGFAVAIRKWQRFAINLVLSGDVTFGLSRASVDPRGGFMFLAGVQYAITTWFAFAIDLQTHFGERAPLDYFAPAAALRFRLYKGLGLELAGMIPVLGEDRHDALVTLRGGWRFF